MNYDSGLNGQNWEVGMPGLGASLVRYRKNNQIPRIITQVALSMSSVPTQQVRFCSLVVDLVLLKSASPDRKKAL